MYNLYIFYQLFEQNKHTMFVTSFFETQMGVPNSVFAENMFLFFINLTFILIWEYLFFKQVLAKMVSQFANNKQPNRRHSAAPCEIWKAFRAATFSSLKISSKIQGQLSNCSSNQVQEEFMFQARLLVNCRLYKCYVSYSRHFDSSSGSPSNISKLVSVSAQNTATTAALLQLTVWLTASIGTD